MALIFGFIQLRLSDPVNLRCLKQVLRSVAPAGEELPEEAVRAHDPPPPQEEAEVNAFLLDNLAPPDHWRGATALVSPGCSGGFRLRCVRAARIRPLYRARWVYVVLVDGR